MNIEMKNVPPFQDRSERALHQRMLRAIQPLIEQALADAGAGPDDIRWTEMRHEMPDITASWPKDRPTRNIHLFVAGPGPSRFPIEGEGAAWEDDEERLERRVLFFSFAGPRGEPPGVLLLEGDPSRPKVIIPNKGEFLSGLKELASNVMSATVSLANPGSVYPLEPDPRRL